jgi:IclR family pca regulon transcriptional regulator
MQPQAGCRYSAIFRVAAGNLRRNRVEAGVRARPEEMVSDRIPQISRVGETQSMERQSESKSPASGGTMKAKTLLKGIRVLEVFDHTRRELSLSEIVKLTNLEISAARRFISSLREAGYLYYNPEIRRYRLSPKVLGFATAYLGSDPLVASAHFTLQQISHDTGHFVELRTLDRNMLVTLLRFSDRYNQLSQFRGSSIGAREPLHCMSGGIALLSRLNPNEARRLLSESTLQKYTERTITDIDELLRRVEQARRLNYAICDREYSHNIIGVGAPLVDFTGYAVGSISIAMSPRDHSVAKVKKKFVPMILKAANTISLAYQRGT